MSSSSGSAGFEPSGFDEAFTTMPKLKLAAFLAGCAEAEFGAVVENCGISASTLSKTATALEEPGYLNIRKGHIGRRPRTWLSLTVEGRAAFERHLAALSKLTEQGRMHDADSDA